MIAPRKKLWSTPEEVIKAAIELIQPTDEDVVYDIGAGDGRFILECAKNCCCKLIGIEIDEERARNCNECFKVSKLDTRCTVECRNALEVNYADATAVFMYLTERGLRLIFPLLVGHIKRNFRMVTYMSPIPNCNVPYRVVKVKTTTHPVGEWPLYYYEVRNISNTEHIVTEGGEST